MNIQQSSLTLRQASNPDALTEPTSGTEETKVPHAIVDQNGAQARTRHTNLVWAAGLVRYLHARRILFALSDVARDGGPALQVLRLKKLHPVASVRQM